MSSCCMKNKGFFLNTYLKITKGLASKAKILKWKMGMMGKYFQEKCDLSHEGETWSYS